MREADALDAIMLSGGGGGRGRRGGGRAAAGEAQGDDGGEAPGGQDLRRRSHACGCVPLERQAKLVRPCTAIAVPTVCLAVGYSPAVASLPREVP